MSKNILALDISTQSTGYALYSGGHLLISGAIIRKSKKNQDWLFRVRSMIEELGSILDGYKIEVLVVENSFNALSVKTLKTLCLSQGLFIGAFLQDRELLFVYPREWQAHHGLGKMKREELKLKSKEKASKISKLSSNTDDEADAILIGKYIVDKGEDYVED